MCVEVVEIVADEYHDHRVGREAQRSLLEQFDLSKRAVTRDTEIQDFGLGAKAALELTRQRVLKIVKAGAFDHRIAQHHDATDARRLLDAPLDIALAMRVRTGIGRPVVGRVVPVVRLELETEQGIIRALVDAERVVETHRLGDRSQFEDARGHLETREREQLKHHSDQVKALSNRRVGAGRGFRHYPQV